MLYGGNEYIVERKGLPMVAIIPVKKFKQMDNARQRFFKNISKISDSFKGVNSKVIDDILKEATLASKENEPSVGKIKSINPKRKSA